MAERKPQIGTIGLLIDTGTPPPIVLVCQTDLTFDRSRDVVDANSKCGPDQQPANTATYEVSGTAQILLGDDDEAIFSGKASEALLDQYFRAKTKFNWIIGPLSGVEVPGDVVYNGVGFLSNLSTSYPNEDVATFDFTLSVVGEYTQVITPATT